MSSFWLVVIGLWCSAVLAIAGCAPPNPPGVTADIYTDFRRPIAPNKTIQHVLNRIGGDIIIVAGPVDHASADVDLTGFGRTPEAARFEAASHIITVTNDVIELNGNSPGSQDYALLHAVVPASVNLPDINARAGNIEIDGNVGAVTARVSESGNLIVRGADGNVNLLTPRGFIIADIMPNRDVTVQATEGNIDIRAENALVSAATTSGNIRFYGTLRVGQTHHFTTTGAGNIHVAVPAYPAGSYPQTPQAIYRFNITTSANPIDVEYPKNTASNNAALAICGFIHSSGPYDYHIENTPVNTGRIEISPVITSAYFFTGTLGTTYYRFDTNQTQVSFFTPITQSIHIYTAAQLNEIIAGKETKETIAPDCQAALTIDLTNAITLTLKTDRGTVYVHQTIMR